MEKHVCSICGAEAYFDGRCGDGPVLMCGCDRRGRRWINDGRGGYYSNPSGASPIPQSDYDYGDYEDWGSR